MDENQAKLTDETNDILTSLVLVAESQERYLKKLHFWVKLAGVYVLVLLAVSVLVLVFYAVAAYLILI